MQHEGYSSLPKRVDGTDPKEQVKKGFRSFVGKEDEVVSRALNHRHGKEPPCGSRLRCQWGRNLEPVWKLWTITLHLHVCRSLLPVANQT